MEKQSHSPERNRPQAELSPELAKGPETKRGPEVNAEQLEKKAEQAREAIDKLDVEPKSEDAPKPQAPQHPLSGIGRKLNYQHTMSSLQRQLKPMSRSFSKVIHNPVVETVSEAAGKTVARPSVTLGATTTAVLVGGTLYIVARAYGYQLGGAELILCLIVGGAFGLLIEGAARVLRKP